MSKTKPVTIIFDADCEGKVFEYISFHGSPMMGYYATLDHYAVIDGVVYFVSNNQRQAWGDTVKSLRLEANYLGDYNPTVCYSRISHHLTWKQAKRLLKL